MTSVFGIDAAGKIDKFAFVEIIQTGDYKAPVPQNAGIGVKQINTFDSGNRIIGYAK